MPTTAVSALLALFTVCLVLRALRRLVVALIVAVLAAGGALTARHGVDVGDVARCETRAVKRAAAQLWTAAWSSSPSTPDGPLDGLRAIGHCDPQHAPQTPRRTAR